MTTEVNSFTLRDADASDIPDMKKLIFTDGPNQWNFLPEDGVNEHLDGVASGETLGLLAFDGPNLVGMITFLASNPFFQFEPPNADPRESAYIAEAVVSKNHAGRGLGSQMLTEACKKLFSLGKHRIYVDRHEENLASAGMMRKAGFKEISTFDDPAKRFVGSKRTTVCVCFPS